MIGEVKNSLRDNLTFEVINVENRIAAVEEDKCSTDFAESLSQLLEPTNGATWSTVSNSGLMMCGGLRENGTVVPDCILFVDQQKSQIPMTEPRHGASSVVFKSGDLLVTGGSGMDGTELKSTEIVSAVSKKSSQRPDMPVEMKDHCLLNLGNEEEDIFAMSTTISTEDKHTVLYNKNAGSWSLAHQALYGNTENKAIENPIEVGWFKCAIIAPTIGSTSTWVVIAGLVAITNSAARFETRKNTYMLEVINKDNQISVEAGEWQPGPELPLRVCCGAMVTSSDRRSIVWLGGKHAYSAKEPVVLVLYFRCQSNDDNLPDSCRWSQLAQELRHPHHPVWAVKIPASGINCEPDQQLLGPVCHQNHLLLVENGFCEDKSNSPECSYDGGDCCWPLINDPFCSNCVCHADNSKHESLDATISIPKLKDCPYYATNILGIIGISYVPFLAYLVHYIPYRRRTVRRLCKHC